MQKTGSEYLFLIKLGYYVLVMGGWMVRYTAAHSLVCLNPNLIRKRYPHLVLHWGLKESLEDHVT